MNPYRHVLFNLFEGLLIIGFAAFVTGIVPWAINLYAMVAVRPVDFSTFLQGLALTVTGLLLSRWALEQILQRNRP